MSVELRTIALDAALRNGPHPDTKKLLQSSEEIYNWLSQELGTSSTEVIPSEVPNCS